MEDKIFSNILVRYWKTNRNNLINTILSTDKRIYNDIIFSINKYSKNLSLAGIKIREKEALYDIKKKDDDLVINHKINIVYEDKKWISHYIKYEKKLSDFDIEKHYENIIKENSYIDLKNIFQIIIYEYRSQYELSVEEMTKNINKQHISDQIYHKIDSLSVQEQILLKMILTVSRNIDIVFW